MNWKCIILGAVIFFIVTNVIGFAVSGPLIHEGVMDALYSATESFWRPELRTDPPDMGALMPMWILNGFLFSLVVAWLYCYLGRCVGGAGWLRGLKFGLALAVFSAALMLAWSGIFDLPGAIWMWWAIDAAIGYAIGGAALGWAAGKWGGMDAA